MNLSKEDIRTYKLPDFNDFDLNYINQNLIINDIIGEYDYTIKNSKSTAQWKVYQKDGITLIINTKNNGFYNENNKSDGGGAYVFLQNHISGSYKSKPNLSGFEKRTIFVIAHKLLNLPEYKKAISKNTSITKLAKTEYNFRITPFLNKNFLKHRGISNSIITDKLFKNKIFNSKVQMPENKGGGIITNTAFPLFDVNHFNKRTGYISRNKKYYSHQTNKIENPRYFNGDSNSMWHSNMPKELKNITIAESEIDILSHYQIKKPKDTLYLSLGGALNTTKIKNVNTFIENQTRDNKDISITSITDNDFIGKYYDLEILATLINQNQNQINIEVDKSKTNIDLLIHSNSSNIDINNQWKKYVEKIDAINQSNKNSISMLTKESVFKLSFNDNIKTQDFNELLTFINKSYLPEIKFKTDKSKLNDWNDDLIKLSKKKNNRFKIS